MNKWPILTLAEVCEVITDGAHLSPKENLNGLPMGSVKDLTRYGINVFSCKRISQEDFDALVRQGCSPKQGDVLIAKDGNSALDTVCVYRQDDKLVLLSSVAILRPNRKVTPDYLNYYLDAADTRQMLKEGFRSGSAIPRVVLRDFRRAPIPVPPIEVQKEIGKNLRTLDEKIELNCRMNETLEAMARAIFQSWFVDFDPVRAKASGEPAESVCQRLGLTPELLALFPDSLEDSELGEIPNGWCIRKVEDIALKIGMGPFGSNIKVSTFVNDGVPVVSGQHVKEVMLDDNTYKFISVEHADRLSSANVGCGDVIFTHAGNIGQVSYIPDHSKYERYVLSQRQFYLRCDSLKVSHLFMTYYFRSPLGQHLLLANASQVGVPSIARPVSYLKTIKLAIPPRNILDRFDGVVRSFHHRVSANRTEIGNLATVRDSLLTVLLSGDVPTTTQRSH